MSFYSRSSSEYTTGDSSSSGEHGHYVEYGEQSFSQYDEGDYEKSRAIYHLPPEYADSSLAAATNAPLGPNPPAPSTPPNFMTRRKKWCVCIMTTLVILTIIITLCVLFLVQRDVNFDIVPLSLSNVTIDPNPSGFTVPINPSVQAENDNFFDVHLTNVVVNGFHPLYGGGAVALASS